MLQEIIKNLLYLTIFLLPIQTRWIIKYGEINSDLWGYGTISLYAVDILLLLLITLFLSDYFLNKRTLKLNKNKKIIRVWSIIALLELAIISSIFASTDKLVAFWGYSEFLLGISLLLFIIYTNYNFTKLIYAFFAGVLTQAFLGIWQFLTQSSFRTKWLGMSLHDPMQPGTSVIETFNQLAQSERWLRAYGGLDHPNVLGGLLVVAIILITNYELHITNYPKSRVKDFKIKIPDSRFQILNSKFNILNTLLFLTFLTALFFTFSRAAWLGLCVGIFILFAIAIYKKEKTSLKKLFQLGSISIALIAILFSQFHGLVFTRLAADTRLEVKSSQERLASYARSFEIIKDHWFWGVGIGNYTLADRDIDLQNNITYPNWHYQPVHNTFLLILTEIGIIGLLAFIGLIIILIQDPKQVSKLSIPIIFALLTIMIFDHWLWSLHFGILLFWFSVGIIIKIHNIEHTTHNKILIYK